MCSCRVQMSEVNVKHMLYKQKLFDTSTSDKLFYEV